MARQQLGNGVGRGRFAYALFFMMLLSASGWRVYSMDIIILDNETSLEPTLMPTEEISPTPNPTEIDLISFTAVQRVNGIALASWNGNLNVEVSFRQAVVSCLNNIVDYGSVTINYVTAGSSDSSSDGKIELQLRSVSTIIDRRRSLGEKVTTSSSVQVTYQVIQDANGYTSDSVSSLLETNVNNGYFTSYLQAYGSANGAPALSAAFSSPGDFELIAPNTPTVAPTEMSSHTTTGGSKNAMTLSRPEIAIVVILVVVGYLVFVLVWRCAKRFALEKHAGGPGHELYIDSPLPQKASIIIADLKKKKETEMKMASDIP